MVGWSLLTDTGAIKRAGVPILRSLNIQFRLKQQALADWVFAIERLHDRILYDRDYEMDFTDESPDDSKAVNSALGIPKAYFTSIPLAEPDGRQMLEVIRRLLS